MDGILYDTKVACKIFVCDVDGVVCILPLRAHARQDTHPSFPFPPFPGGRHDASHSMLIAWTGGVGIGRRWEGRGMRCNMLAHLNYAREVRSLVVLALALVLVRLFCL